jgi:hypothetical protein
MYQIRFTELCDMIVFDGSVGLNCIPPVATGNSDRSEWKRWQSPQVARSGMPLPVAPSHTQSGRRADDPNFFPGDGDHYEPPPTRAWGEPLVEHDPRVYKYATNRSILLIKHTSVDNWILGMLNFSCWFSSVWPLFELLSIKF